MFQKLEYFRKFHSSLRLQNFKKAKVNLGVSPSFSMPAAKGRTEKEEKEAKTWLTVRAEL